MIRLGPLTLAWTKEVDALHEVVKAAWPLEQAINFDQTHDYSELMPLMLELAEALSHAPLEDAPTAQKILDHLTGPKPYEWQIHPQDVRWNYYEASVILEDGWEPFGVSLVPNTLDQNQFRLWLRRPLPKKHRHHHEIKVQSAGWGGHQVGLHLAEGWKPFGLSISPPDQPIVWFSRRM